MVRAIVVIHRRRWWGGESDSAFCLIDGCGTVDVAFRVGGQRGELLSASSSFVHDPLS